LDTSDYDQANSIPDRSGVIVTLRKSGEWRKIEATDASGKEFDVELRMSRKTMDGQDIFTLNLRRPEEKLSH